jgi:RNA polymerase sigma-19 factor, ECF subfamily
MDEAVKPPPIQSTVARLFKAHSARMRNFLRFRLRNHEEAQDAAQDVFLRLWEREREGALQADARAYMVSAVFHAAVDVTRRRSRSLVDEHEALDDEQLPDPSASVESRLFWRNALRQLVDALKDLPVTTQQVFVMAHVEGLTHTVIAERLEISVRHVERHLVRALGHCELRLKDYLE